MDLDSAGEKLVHLGLHERHLQDLLDGGTLVWILDQHLRKQLLEVWRVHLRKRRIRPLQDLLDQAFHVLGVKGVVESGDLIENAPKTPNIRFLIVRFLLANFRRKVVRSADGSIGAVVGVLQYSGDAEVSNLDVSLRREENVLRFQIAMQDLFVMDVIHSQGHLHQPRHNLLLWKQSPQLFLSRYLVEHIPALTVIHDDTEAPECDFWYIFSMNDSR